MRVKSKDLAMRIKRNANEPTSRLPRVFERSDHNNDPFRTEECGCCGQPTAYGLWIQTLPLRHRYPFTGEHQDCCDEDPRDIMEQYKEATRELESKRLLRYTHTVTSHHLNKKKSPTGSFYLSEKEVNTHYFEEICATCFAMEPAIMEAIEQGWRFCRFKVPQRCRCGRTIPVVLSCCVTCHRESRMLESRLLTAKRNRQVIEQLNERLQRDEEREHTNDRRLAPQIA